MIDNSHLIGVLMEFLIGVMTVAFFTTLVLACGFAIALVLRLRKSFIHRKPNAAGQTREANDVPACVTIHGLWR